MTEDPPAANFLYGTDMEPAAIRAAWPGGRFVARARVLATATVLPPLPETEAPPHLPGAAVSPPNVVWGILIQLPSEQESGAESDSPLIESVTDDGRHIPAHIVTNEGDIGDPAAVVAAARYWELPVPYLRRLIAWGDQFGDAGVIVSGHAQTFSSQALLC